MMLWSSFSIALVKFANKPDEQYIIVGMSRDLVLAPRSLSGGLLQTYKITEGGSKLEHVHTTPVEDVPGAIAGFQGRVLIGVGRFLRVYDLGKKKLLRKCENKVRGLSCKLGLQMFVCFVFSSCLKINRSLTPCFL